MDSSIGCGAGKSYLALQGFGRKMCSKRFRAKRSVIPAI
jgi:hypothetical protein